MQKLSQYLLMIIASISVLLLGYHAYMLSTDTFSFAFNGQENQSNSIRVAFSKPWLSLGDSQSDQHLDKDALVGSITKNGKPWNPTLSGEGYMMVSGEYFEIVPVNFEKNDTINISAKTYNANKKTGWKIPRDIKGEYSEKNKTLFIQEIGLPRDMTYQVTLAGYPGLTGSDLRWYIKKRNDAGDRCTIETWNTNTWKKIGVHKLSSYTHDGEERSIYKIDQNDYPNNACLMIGLGGDHSYIQYRQLSDLTLTGTVTDILSAEYDMWSRIEFNFSDNIFTDTGALYSDEYIENRHTQKAEFLKKLSITPDITISENDIELSPNKAVVYAPFIEGKKYNISLDDTIDIYGRNVSSDIEVIAKSTPSIAIRLANNKTIVKQGDPIGAKLYRSASTKNEYEIKLCQISLDAYARVERMNELKNTANIDSLYTLLQSKDVSLCSKKTIALMPDSSLANFDVNQFSPKGLLPGLYILAFQNKDDITGFDKWISPRTFSVIDTHLTMKIDSSGKTYFLATDIKTGEPRKDQEVTIKQNISSLYTQNWNNATNNYDVTYIPLNSQSWGTGNIVGKTNTNGILEKQNNILTGDNPYGYTTDWHGDYEGRYNSFVAISRENGHFGYVVSTWNDGITGWNFGLKESDYTWDNRSLYSAYIHTDRRLYLPGETVYIKAIMRKNEKSLTIPENEAFDITITDSEGKTVSTSRIKANAFGSLATSIVLGSGTTLGNYSISVQNAEYNGGWVSGGYTNFQVEIFKNPTFTASVELTSPDIKDDVVNNIRKTTNTDPNNSWYSSVFSSTFDIQGIVKAHYYNGATIKSVPFTYRIYKSVHYNDNFWGDCFWGCYGEGERVFYTEGTGSIDSDGIGIFRSTIDFSSFSDDYIYTAEVTITDPLTSESVTTPGTILAQIGAEYKMFDINNPLMATLEKRILMPGEAIRAQMTPKYGKWDQTLSGKYGYEFVRRTYTSEKISTLRTESSPIIHTVDTIIKSGKITDPSINIETKGQGAGEYILRVIPLTEKDTPPPKESIQETILFISGDFVSRDNQLRIIPEKTVYKSGEKARVLITTPFSSGGHLYITRERGGILDHEYIAFSGSSYTREYTVDESFYPNVYLGVVAFPKDKTSDRSYGVGYSEIIMDITDKKGNIEIKTNKQSYKNGEKVELTLSLKNRENIGTPGELEIMVIDESLIRLLGNIDLDIIPKFFQKYPFTMRTALTAIGMERNLFLSRKGSNGGSGDKGGDGAQISSRTIFKNTAYYNPSLLTDKNGNATVKFDLPDNVTDYRIIVIGQTRASQFSVSEKTIAVRRDYTLETHAPMMVYQGDKTTFTASAFNSTNRITPVVVNIEIGTGGSLMKKTESLILSPSSIGALDFSIDIGKNWEGTIPYTITLREKNTILDSITKTIVIKKPIIITDLRKVSGVTNTGLSIPIPLIGKNINPDSEVTISISDSPLQNPEKIIASLVSYPYGCIEQTISSTLPNAIAIRLSDSLKINIDRSQAEKNLQDGVSKILKMQDISGGWKYWEQDTMPNNHVTPYVIRSLYEFRKLGVQIPDNTITAGIAFMLGQPIDTSSYDAMDQRSEIFATLALARHPSALEYKNTIDIQKLSRHGYLMYHWGLLSLGQFSENEKKNLINRMNSRNSETYWYWDDNADRAIYSRILLESGDRSLALESITSLLTTLDMNSYFTSTQAKIQVFMTLIGLSGSTGGLPNFAIETGSLKINVNPKTTTHRYSYTTRRGLIGKTIDLKNIPQGKSIFYEIALKDAPLKIEDTQAITHPELSVKRVFEKVDESKGLDNNNQFLVATPVTNGVFKNGELYRVRISVTPKHRDTTKYYLTLEDYIPGAWRPIRGIFDTESSSTTDASTEYGYWNGWTHVESQLDRILATQDYVWRLDNPYTYTYYIRPEFTGTYLLSPVTAYYMYQGDIHATSKYEKVIVE